MFMCSDLFWFDLICCNWKFIWNRTPEKEYSSHMDIDTQIPIYFKRINTPAPERYSRCESRRSATCQALATMAVRLYLHGRKLSIINRRINLHFKGSKSYILYFLAWYCPRSNLSSEPGHQISCHLSFRSVFNIF